jgi:hypothetical protein
MIPKVDFTPDPEASTSFVKRVFPQDRLTIPRARW